MLRQRAGRTGLDPVTIVKDVAPPSDDDSASTVSLSDDDQSLPAFTPPSFTIKQLLGAIPAHCYERSALKSSLYILQDVAIIACFVYVATFINPSFGRRGALVDGLAGQVVRQLAWGLYAFLTGLPATGLWVIAHECGHQGFSPSKTINNSVGWVLHSALLVPYHSWRISHAKHHAATGHMTRDQVFVPRTRSQRGLKSRAQMARERAEGVLEKADDLFEDAPLWVLMWVVLQQLFGWPLYLIRNASGQVYDRRTNHFEPSSPIFDKRHYAQVLVSDLGLAITIGALAFWGSQRGSLEVLRYYVAPYLWVNYHLVAITYLQHSHPMLPHYREGEWNFQRGALCTIDRPYFGFFMHGISETHIAHHLCSKLPHYNAWEATDALKKVLGEHYMYSARNPTLELFTTYRDCRFVEDEGDVVFYKDSRGRAARRVVFETPVSDSGIDAVEPVES